jgi:hypothetical protein
VEEITEIYGPLPTIKAAEDAAATRPSRRQLEAVLDKMAQKGLIETAVVNGEKRWYARKED